MLQYRIPYITGPCYDQVLEVLILITALHGAAVLVEKG